MKESHATSNCLHSCRFYDTLLATRLCIHFTDVQHNIKNTKSIKERSYHSSHLISSQLTSFHHQWVAVSALWSDPVRRGCDQSKRSRSQLSRLTGRSHGELDRFTGSQRTHYYSVPMKWGQLRWGQMRWDEIWVIWTLRQTTMQLYVIQRQMVRNTQTTETTETF